MFRRLFLFSLLAVFSACPGPAPLPFEPEAPVDSPDGSVPVVGAPPRLPVRHGSWPDVAPPDLTVPDASVPDMNEPDASVPDAGVVLFAVGGALELGAHPTIPAGVRPAVLWFPDIGTTSPRAFAGVEAGPALTGSNWNLELRHEPPAIAQGPVSPSQGATGSISYGVIVLWRDLDGDDVLTGVDSIEGSSAGAMPFDADGPYARTLLVWRQGHLGADEADFVEGFNVVNAVAPFEALRPITGSVRLAYSQDPRLKLMTCDAAFSSDDLELACGQLRFLTPRVNALASTYEDDLMVIDLSVFGGSRQIIDAQVSINGVDVPVGPGGGYAMFEMIPTKSLRSGQNTLRVMAPGYLPLTVDVFFPVKPSFLAPSAGASLAVSTGTQLSWSVVPHSTKFTASLRGPLNTWGFAITDLTSAVMTTPSIAGPGELMLEVEARTPVARHEIVGTNKVSMPVTLVP
jgi:hypothetical protein